MKLLQANHGQRSVVEMLIQTHLNNINTCVLAKIAKVTSGSSIVEVELMTKRSYIDENNIRQYDQFGNIDVRLSYLKGLTATTKVGDYGLLIVCQSAIEPFLSGALDNPRKYNLLDGFFVPLAYATDANETDLKIESASGEDVDIISGKDVDVTVQGKFTVTKGSEELVSILADLADVCSQIQVDTGTGELLPTLVTSFESIKSKIEDFA